MAPAERDTPENVSTKGILTRFAHLLSAQGIDGIIQLLFFLYLAWIDTEVYGEVMYAMQSAPHSRLPSKKQLRPLVS